MRSHKWILVFAFTLLFCFSACGKNDANAPESSVPTGESGSEELTELTEELPDIPLTADYGGDPFNILTAGNIAYQDFTVDDESSIALDNAQYKRRKKVEEDYRVQIREDAFVSYSSGGGPGYSKISMAVNSGDCLYDLALIAGYDVSVLAYSGYLYDMNSVPGIDLKKSWWDQKANESLSVRGVMFFTTGEITLSDNDAAFVIMMNKDLLKNYELENPYQMVYDGTWTWENFGKLCKAVTEDLNQDGKMDRNDCFGLLVMDDSSNGVISSVGERCCTINDEGKIELTIYNETVLSALEQYFAIAYDTQYAFTYQRVEIGTKLERELWSGNHGLFWTTYMGIVPSFREMESDFGLLPYPKLNEAQQNYYSLVMPYLSQFICIPLIQDDLERTGTITEALAYYGKELVTPAYYDVSLIGQHTRDEESSDMLDIVFANLVYDIGYYYQVGPYNKHLIYMVREFDTNFASRYEKYRPASENLLAVINDCYARAVDEWK